MANEGQKACVHYVGTFDDGSVFDDSRTRGETFDFIVGGDDVLPGFDEAVRTMEVGDTRMVRVEAKDAYGEYSQDAIQTERIEDLPGGEELLEHAGETMYADFEGELMEARVIDNGDGTLSFDFNHPMAGKALNFEITLVEVNDEMLEHPGGPRTKSIPKPEAPAAPGEIA